MNFKMSFQRNVVKFAAISALIAVAAFSGCKSTFFGGTESAPSNQAPQAPPAPVVVDGVRTSYADVVDKTSPAVVMIQSERKASAQSQQFPFGDFFNLPNMPQQPQEQQRPLERGVGSGVIVSADGTILTNNHVVDGAEKITIQMNDKRTFEAKIVGSDPPSDLAVLKIEGENLPFLTLGNSDNVRIGDIVLAIGNPLGIGQTVTAGIISAKGRQTGISDGSFEDFLQTDAPINRGNSGGALVNLTGELIGINSQILSGGNAGGNIGIGFSIPSNMAKSVMEQLLKDGKVRRGMLGVNIQNLTEDIAKNLELNTTKGVVVSNVRTGSAAEKAGIKTGDIIIAINGENVEDSNTLRNKVAGTLPGTEITIKIIRDGSETELKATLDEFEVPGAATPGQEPKKNNPDGSEQNGKLGLSLQPITPEIAKQLKLESTNGLVVTNVDPNGAAAEKGMQRGDVILQINRQPVSSLDEVRAAIEKSGDRPVLLLVSRGGVPIFLTVSPK
ncbi:MAG: DegQ family serine endoprotease [Pyrinomonadaceae bacterium]|nr:DegQ family serine endoprotease [Pyrinomonadaceae bacterium]